MSRRRLSLTQPHIQSLIQRTRLMGQGMVGGLLVFLSAGMIGESLADWVEQGPGPTINGQTEGLTETQNPVSGAINAIVPDPTNADILYVGTVNGGIWKTTNAKMVNPFWEPLTDTQLPALSIASLAVSPADSTVFFAGTGSTSANSGQGDPGFGIARSDDGGKQWKVLGGLLFNGLRITQVVPLPKAFDGGGRVLTANFYEKGGVYLSRDKGEDFVRLSGATGSALPDAGVSSLIVDASSPRRLYAAIPKWVPGLTGGVEAKSNAGSSGIYSSDDGGLTWERMSAPPFDDKQSIVRILLSSHGSPGHQVLYAAVAIQKLKKGKTDEWEEMWDSVYRYTPEAGWVALPAVPNVSPGGQASLHGALQADRADPYAVYLSGDRQDALANGDSPSKKAPNALGCTEWSANIYKYNGTKWDAVVCNGANKTSPHADSRAMAFDADGNLLEASDGGVYRLLNPNSQSRRWVSVLGNLRLAEVISAAYDPVNQRVFGGTQDNGSASQTKPNNIIWDNLLMGDGGVVAVESHPKVRRSIRYYTYANLNDFTRSTWNAKGEKARRDHSIKLIVKGSRPPKPLNELEQVPFYARYVLNAVKPEWMLIGTDSKIFGSFNRGDRVDEIKLPMVSSSAQRYVKSLAYGGYLKSKSYPDLIYVGTSSKADPEPEGDEANTGAGISIRSSDTLAALEPQVGKTKGEILQRRNAKGAMKVLDNYPGSGVVDIALDPMDYRNIFVCDDENAIWASFDEGQHWENVTSGLPQILEGSVRTLVVKGQEPKSPDTVLVAGGEYGVAQLRNPKPNSRSSWERVGENLPHALVMDLRYESKPTGVLSAGTLGRGVWTTDFK